MLAVDSQKGARARDGAAESDPALPLFVLWWRRGRRPRASAAAEAAALSSAASTLYCIESPREPSADPEEEVLCTVVVMYDRRVGKGYF